ncbi:MAG: hypothetical protein IH597_04660 [Bacteroidales bacterium]|nr:hypothetical protein [Bacteroidales bacterium]
MCDTNNQVLYRQLSWDYNISPEEIALVIKGEKEMAGHYNRQTIFKKALETYPWFTIIQLFEPGDISLLLTDELISSLRMPSLRKQYEFIKKRLQETLPTAG